MSPLKCVLQKKKKIESQKHFQLLNTQKQYKDGETQSVLIKTHL